MKLQYIFLLFSLLPLCIAGCLGKSTNTKEDSLAKQEIIELKEKELLLKTTLNIEHIEHQHETIENKNLVELGKVSDYYYENPDYSIKKFLSKIDSITFYNSKDRLNNNLDTMSLIKPKENVLAIPTEVGYVNYKIKPFNDYGYEGEEYEHKGVYNGLNAYVISKHIAEGFGYDFVYASSGKTVNLNGFPYLSNNGKLIFTCHIEAENIVYGFVKIYSANPEDKGMLWGGWSDYTLLPIEAVWESDSTVLIRAEQYNSENDYYERKINGYKYGRLTIQM